MRGRFSGKTVLVTGGGRGIGGVIARAFGAHGAHVIVNYFHSPEAATATAQEIVEVGGSAETVRASVAKPDQVRDMFAALAARLDGLDVLVNNAARGVFGELCDATDDDWHRVLDTNLHGARRCAQAALPLLAARHGIVINMSSTGSERTLEGYGVIGVSKAALEALTRYQAGEFARHGVRVNVVSAPPVDNRVTDYFPHPDRMRGALIAGTPGGRMTREEDLARAVLLMAAPEAGWVTGQTLIADGGFSVVGVSTSGGREDTAATPPVAGAPTTEPDPIAIVGMGLVAPGVADVNGLWRVLGVGRPTYGEPGGRYRLPDFHSTDPAAMDRTYARVAGVIHEDPPADGSDFATTWLRRALRQATAGVHRAPGDRAAFVVGMWPDGSQHLEESVAVRLAARGVATAGGDGEQALHLLRRQFGCVSDTPARHTPREIARAAMQGVLAPDTTCLTVDTACSSSLYAIDLGVRALLDGDADVAHCGGVNAFGPRVLVVFAKLKGLSAAGHVRSFDTAADGTLFSDGAGIVTLKRLSRARADGDRVLAVLAGFGASSDGRGTAIYAPNVDGQRIALRRAYEVNGVGGDDVDLVVSHATGTVAGDGTELSALATGATSRAMTCVANKALLGHTGWAAGVVSVIHAALCLRERSIPAQPLFTGLPDGARDLPVRVPTEPAAFAAPVRTVGVSSMGFGGTNAHLLLRDAPAGRPPPASGRPLVDDDLLLVAFSAHLPGGPGHDEVAARIAAGLDPATEPGFGDDHPLPPFADIRMSRRTARAVDRCQLMALSAAAAFAGEHGRLWHGLEERTGVFCAHTGLTRLSMEATARSYAHGIERVLAGTPQAAPYGEWLRRLREQTPAITEDTMPGLMPNVIPARLARQFDLRGPTMTLDTGPDSGLAALYAAAAYLRRAEIDLALVLGAHGNLLDPYPTDGGPPLAEGAFLLAVARGRTVADNNWPVLARLRPALRPGAGTGEVRAVEPVGRYSYGGADSVLAVLRAALRPEAGTVVHGAPDSPQVAVLPVRKSAAAPTPPDPPYAARRYLATFAEQGRPHRAGTTPDLPGNALVLTDSAATAAALAPMVARAGGRLLCTDPAASAEATVVTHVDEDSLDATGPARHIRVVASFGAGHRPKPPGAARLALHELMFLAVKTNFAGIVDGGSVAVALMDPATGGAVHPDTALFTGTVKSMAWELPPASVHALITDTGAPETALAQVDHELGGAGGLPVTWYHDGRRLAETLAPAPPPADDTGLSERSTVVAVGGARGITAAVVAALARRHRPRLWVLGSGDLDRFSATDLAALDRDVHGGRTRYIREQRTADPRSRVAEINRRFDRLRDAHEAVTNLRTLARHVGADRVTYLRCDITDPAAVDHAAATILDHGDVDLLINGAGQHHAASLPGKDLATFRRVRDVKLLGGHHLRTAFAARPPRRWCNFGSMAGFCGLPGEADYAAANEILAAAARHRPTHEYTIEWPKWADSGIVTRDFVDNQEYSGDRFSAIRDAEGVAHFLAELRPPRRDTAHAVVAVAGDLEIRSIRDRFPGFRLADDPTARRGERGAPARPYLGRPEHRDADRARWSLVLDGRLDSVLRHHLVDGTPTLPGTFALEVAAEAALDLLPGTRPIAFRGAAFDAFICADAGRTRGYAVRATVIARRDTETDVEVTIVSDVVRAGRVLRRDRPHCTAVVTVGTGPTPQRRWAGGTDGARPVRDPTYHPGGPVRLTGMFHNTRECRADPGYASALWRPPPEHLDAHLEGCAVPALLLDAMVRVAALPLVAAGRTAAAVPRRLREVRVHHAGPDTHLAGTCRDGIRIAADGERGICVAVAPDGVVLAEILGPTFTDLAARGSTPMLVPGEPAAGQIVTAGYDST
ncbi:SDR family oxidoreductase [Polymorphospora sp. NPDC050346]|uniref:SDR family oxidoreductase n=1 Tax=Polymorphospora sp. NPDC050346 TaxID=3155780 RepID=UPI0033C88BF1